jgi:hypothetical protein
MGDKEQAPDKQTPAEVPPPVPPPVDPPQPPPNPDPKNGEDPRKMSKSEKIMVWATCVIAAGTLVSAGAICFQWYEMHTGGADTKAIANAAQKQVCAANRSVDAAQKFADTAEDINKGIKDAAQQLQASAENSKQWTKTVQASMRLDQRAWLSATSTGQTIAISKPISANLRLQNVGRTPAMRISGLIKMESIPQDKTPTFLYKQKIVKGEPTVGDFNLATMLPNAQANLRIPAAMGVENGKQVGEIVLDQPNAEALAAGTVKLYLHGEINYCDIFKVRHWIKFCFVYEPNPMQQIANPDGSSFIACRQHNETDDESDKQERCPAPKPN